MSRKNMVEYARKYATKAKGLASEVRYHRVEVTNDNICRRVLTDLLPTLIFVDEGFALGNKSSLDKLDIDLVIAKELKI